MRSGRHDIAMKRTLILIWLGCLLLVPRCDLFEDDDDTAVPLAFEAIEEVERLTIVDPGTAVFRDKPSWEAFWAAHSANSPPVVDFEQNILIAVFWGAGYSGSHNRVEAITGILAFRDRIETTIGPLPPDPGEALVYPIEVVRVERRELPVVFRGEVPH